MAIGEDELLGIWNEKMLLSAADWAYLFIVNGSSHKASPPYLGNGIRYQKLQHLASAAACMIYRESFLSTRSLKTV
jgi:hypothetical protein